MGSVLLFPPAERLPSEQQLNNQRVSAVLIYLLRHFYCNDTSVCTTPVTESPISCPGKTPCAVSENSVEQSSL